MITLLFHYRNKLRRYSLKPSITHYMPILGIYMVGIYMVLRWHCIYNYIYYRFGLLIFIDYDCGVNRKWQTVCIYTQHKQNHFIS